MIYYNHFTEALMEQYRVPITLLKNRCDYKQFDFKTTKTLQTEIVPIGQERALEAIDTALNIKKKGFNLFLSGESGCGKSSVIKAFLKQKASTESNPSDWLYLYNFEYESRPIALEIPTGKAKSIAKAMDQMIDEFILEVPKFYDSKHFRDQRDHLLREYDIKESELEHKLAQKIRDVGFILAKTEEGYVANPLNDDGEPLTGDQIVNLGDKERKKIERNQLKVQDAIERVYKKSITIEKILRRKLEKHLSQLVEVVLSELIPPLNKKFRNYKELKQHIKNIREHIIENARHFVAQLVEDELLSSYKNETSIKEMTNPYRINAFVNSSKLHGAPVIFENNPTITSLFGMIEYIEDPDQGHVTSFQHIRPGKIHLANGGYLVLEAMDLYKNPPLWEMLKRVIRNEEIQIGEDTYVHSSRIAVRIEPQPIPVKLKVILVGDSELHNFFASYDEIFPRLFKVKADFHSEILRTDENERKYAAFIGSKCAEDQLLHLDKSAVGKIIEYSSRMADDHHMLSTNFSKIVDVLVEADYMARSNKRTIITAGIIEATTQRMDWRLKKESETFHRWIKDNVVYIDTDSDKIGQINGLTVLTSGSEYEFGLPVRITAKTYVGDLGIVNIEREVRMSGKIHDKGVMTLSGFMGNAFGQDKPLSFEASITFEQQYYHIDGDSASSTELYALLSSLSEVPINQGIAVTGSVNQNGEIQPIGGVNEKIEGFFEICKHRGLNKNGVMIPKSNVRNLMLSEEIIEAVEAGDFTVYAIETIAEGLKILTGKEMGDIDTPDTIFYFVNEKLKQFYQILNPEEDEKEDKK